jgi:hypothetical protein
MAKVTLGPIVSGISGSVGSAIFSKGANGTNVYSRSHPARKTSKIQPEYQNAFRLAVEAWSTANTNLRTLYNLIAKSAKQYSTIYPARTLTGREYFIKLIVTQRLTGHSPIYATTGPNPAGLGVIQTQDIAFGTPFIGTSILPATQMIPQPAYTTGWGLALFMGYGKPFNDWQYSTELPVPGPAPRNWFRVWPQPLTHQDFPRSGLDPSIVAQSGGFPGINYADLSPQVISRHIWIRWIGFFDWAVYASAPTCVTVSPSYTGDPPTFTPASPLFTPTGTYTPSWL